jgi:putative DNA primase/helicase
MNERFTESQEAETALTEYKNESNSVISFILEEWQKQSGLRQLKGMYLDYKVYCIDSGRKPVGKITFSERLQLAGFEKSRDSVTGDVTFNLNNEIKKKIEGG